jgi:hypothetical protein
MEGTSYYILNIEIAAQNAAKGCKYTTRFNEFKAVLIAEIIPDCGKGAKTH